MRLATTFAFLLCLSAFAQNKEVRRTIPLSASGHLAVDTYKGDVRVTTWDQPQVEIVARIEAGGTGAESQRLVNETEVRIDATGDSVHLKSDYPKYKWHVSGQNVSLPFVRYSIRMPRTAQLRIKDYKSEIEVSDLHAPLEIDTYKGDTKVRNLTGTIRMNTYKGHGTFDLASLSGHNSFETYKGVFDIRMPSNAGFDIISEAGRHASIRSAFPFVLPAGTYTNGTRLQARVNGGGAEVVLKSYHGEMNLH